MRDRSSQNFARTKSDHNLNLLRDPENALGFRKFFTAKESISPLLQLSPGKCLYFTYGSLKRNFPNHEKFANILSDFVGAAVTIEHYPLVIPNEPQCDNPNCPYLHRMASLIHCADCPNLVGSGIGPVISTPVRSEIVFIWSQTPSTILWLKACKEIQALLDAFFGAILFQLNPSVLLF